MSGNANILSRRMSVALSGTKSRVRAGQPEAGTPFQLRRIDAGRLQLPSGRICVTDAYSAEEHPPLNRLVVPGEHAVELVIALIPEDLPFGGQRCAFAVVTFCDDPVETWETVTAVKPANPCFSDSHPNQFVQEGATGLFSPEAGELHFSKLRKHFDQHLANIRKQAIKFGINDWINYRPAKAAANVIIVEGGMGDGVYECFVGLTKPERVARLVVDFGICETPDQ